MVWFSLPAWISESYFIIVPSLINPKNSMLNGFKYSKTQFDSKFEIDFQFKELVLALEVLGSIQGALVLVWKKKKKFDWKWGYCVFGWQWSTVILRSLRGTRVARSQVISHGSRRLLDLQAMELGSLSHLEPQTLMSHGGGEFGFKFNGEYFLASRPAMVEKLGQKRLGNISRRISRLCLRSRFRLLLLELWSRLQPQLLIPSDHRHRFGRLDLVAQRHT